jgi:hypothetical protein
MKCGGGKDCKCCDTKYSVKVDYCKDICKDCNKKCGNKCEKKCEPKCEPKCESKCDKKCNTKCFKGCKDLCDCSPCKICKSEKCPKFCDSLSVLKRKLCLFNSLSKVTDINNRYTGYNNIFNKCLDCRYPRGPFQAWAMCEDYCFPDKVSRKIDNNSELMALDHILVSECIKPYISFVDMSDLTFDMLPSTNALSKIPFSPVPPAGTLINFAQSTVTGDVPDYSGRTVKSFFTNRVYCVDLRFPCNDICKTECGINLDSLGIKSLWCALDRWGTCEVSIETMREFYLDTHPFFETFFYNTLRNKFNSSGLQQRYDREFGVCMEDKTALRFRKKDKIKECEFYDLMLCIYSNTDRDRFIITLGYLEALIKAIRNGDVQHAHSEVIDLLYDFLDVCYTNKLKLESYLNSYLNVAGDAVTSGIDNSIIQNSTILVCELIAMLYPYLEDNCHVMEILIDRAAAAFDQATYNGIPLNELSPADLDAYQTQFIVNNSTSPTDFFSSECSEAEIKANLPTYVDSSSSIVFLLDNCVKPDKIIPFLMGITVDVISA